MVTKRELEKMTADELVELNQQLGKEIDGLREQRLKVKDAYDKAIAQEQAEAALAGLSETQRAAFATVAGRRDATVQTERVEVASETHEQE